MISQHLPALQVVVPLISAPLCVLLRRAEAAWALALAVSWTALAIAVALLLQVLAAGPITYPIGDWEPPWGIEYRIDVVNAFVLVIVAAIAAVVVPFARQSIAREIAAERVYLFYTLYLLSLAGLLGIAVTGDVFNLFVFLEISSLSSYGMISLGQSRRALTAAYNYLIMGTVGATFYVIGVGMLYMMTGTLNMADLATLLPSISGSRTVLTGLAFLTVGLGLKVALFPLHMWLPNAYTYAPSAVTAFLAATGTKVAIYALMRVLFTVFGKVDLFAVMPLDAVLMAMALAGMFAASLLAIFQDDVKRMLAYSSVAQVGYMVLGVSFISVTGLTGGIIHLFNHALMKCALFLALGCVVLRSGSILIEDMRGMGRRMPLTMAAFVTGGLSLIGVPATVGFVSKWYLVKAALEAGLWPIAVLVVLSSLLAVIYVWRVVEAAYFRAAPEGAPRLAEAPLSMLLPTWLMAGASVYFGIDAATTVGVAEAAARALLGGAP